MNTRYKRKEPQMKSDKRKIGRIIKVFPEGYGFIKSDVRENYYFHISSFPGYTISEIKRGAMVEFDPGETERGLIANRILVVEDPE